MTSRTALALLLLGAACKKAPPAAGPPAHRVLHLVALNDFHGALYELPARDAPGRAYGGLPWLVSAVNALRAQHPELLLLDGGDMFQGAWPVNATRGRGAVEAFNLLGVDASAVGNHEFDYGGIEGGHPLRGALEAGAKLAEYQWLTANISDADGPWAPEGFAPWTLIERGGVRVGVIGLSTQDTPSTTLKAHVADLTFHDVVEVVKREVPAMRAAGAEVIVAVGHLSGQCAPATYVDPGPPCTPDGEVGRLLTELEPGTLDVLVVGHAHTVLHHRVGDTFVLEQRAQGHALGRLELVVGPDGVDPDASVIHPAWFLAHDAVDPGCTGQPFPLDPLDVGGRTLRPDTQALALIAQLEAEAGSLCDEVGCLSAPLGRDRQAQSGVGDLVSDAMLTAFPDVDLAVTNSGGLRADLQAGPLRREHLHAVMPFDNRLVLLELTGAQIQLMLRLGSSGGHGILQVAGGSFQFDPAVRTGSDLDGDGAMADWERDRLCPDATQIGGAPLDPDATYRVVTTDFLYAGGDHLGPAFAGVEVLEEGPLLRDHLGTWAQGLSACRAPDPTARIARGPCR